MKTVVVLLLVVVVVLTGLPIFMGMSGMAACPDCAPAVATVACLVAIVAILASGVGLALSPLAQRVRADRDLVRDLLHSFLLERPPQLA